MRQSLLALGRLCLIVFALLILGSVAGNCQSAPAVTRVRVTPEAARTLDSIASWSRETRSEAVACIPRYAVRDTVLVLERIVPPRTPADSADSMNVYAHRAMCRVGEPGLHTHVAANGSRVPSPMDLNTVEYSGYWQVLLNVYDNGWIVAAYGIVPAAELEPPVKGLDSARSIPYHSVRR